MAKYNTTTDLPDDDSSDDSHGRYRSGPVRPSVPRPSLMSYLVKAGIIGAIVLAMIYPIYYWTVRRIVVPRDHVLVLLKKNGTDSLEGNQIVIPRPPAHDSPAYEEWEKKYGHRNGILEQVYTEGTYFAFSPFDYERELVDISKTAIVPQNKVGIVIRKFGLPLDQATLEGNRSVQPGQVIADRPGQVGPLPITLPPGQHNEYANPYAYEVIHVDPVQIDPGHRGVVTMLAAKKAQQPNSYLVNDGERGVQKVTRPEEFAYYNPYEKRITPVSIRSERWEMSGKDAITFPSYDSFDIKLEGVIEWRVNRDQLAKIFVEYGEGNELIPLLQERVIIPQARSLCRLVGSKYHAREFISGESKLEFQKEFENEMRKACEKNGVLIDQALIRDIIPPQQIKQPINEREIAKQTILTLRQQIQVAKSSAELAKQEELANQNKALGEMNRKLVVVEQESEQRRAVAVTRAEQELEVSKLNLEASVSQAKSLVSAGEADAYTILAQKQAEAEPLRQQVEAFGDGNAYAQYFFFQKVAPSVKSILTDTEGTFGEMFRQLLPQKVAAPVRKADPPALSDAQP